MSILMGAIADDFTGATDLAGIIACAGSRLAAQNNGIIIANHGPVVAGKSLIDAVFFIEELEESAKINLLLREQSANTLTTEQLTELDAIPLRVEKKH